MADDDDDGPEEEEAAQGSVKGLGFSLKMPIGAASGQAVLQPESAGAACGEVTIELICEDGTRSIPDVDIAQTVEFVKARAAALFPEALPAAEAIELTLHGKVLMDPMSLSDYPEFEPGKTVRLECAAKTN